MTCKYVVRFGKAGYLSVFVEGDMFALQHRIEVEKKEVR